MKHMHVQHYWRANHQERASMAVRFARLLREATKPARLWLLAREERSADEHLSDMAATSEWLVRCMVNKQHERVQLAAKRMAIERGVAP